MIPFGIAYPKFAPFTHSGVGALWRFVYVSLNRFSPKVSFGLAHFLADAALQTVCGKTPVLPAGFRLQQHVNIAVTDFGKC